LEVRSARGVSSGKHLMLRYLSVNGLALLPLRVLPLTFIAVVQYLAYSWGSL